MSNVTNMNVFAQIGNSRLCADFTEFRRPQWIRRLKEYSADDAMDTIIWLHDRLRGYDCIHPATNAEGFCTVCRTSVYPDE